MKKIILTIFILSFSFLFSQFNDEDQPLSISKISGPLLEKLGLALYIGLENAKLLAKHLKSSDNFFKLSNDKNMTELSNIDGIGETQIQSIKNFFSNKVNSSLLNFLKLLADRQRIGILTSILYRFLEIYRENSNIALATVTSAVELTDEQKGLITQKIINIAGTEKLELVTKIDPSLIGGFVASVGSKVIDASLASQIRKLGLSLSK